MTWPAGLDSPEYPGMVKNGKFIVWYKNGHQYIRQTFKHGKSNGTSNTWNWKSKRICAVQVKNVKAEGLTQIIDQEYIMTRAFGAECSEIRKIVMY